MWTFLWSLSSKTGVFDASRAAIASRLRPYVRVAVEYPFTHVSGQLTNRLLADRGILGMARDEAMATIEKAIVDLRLIE